MSPYDDGGARHDAAPALIERLRDQIGRVKMALLREDSQRAETLFRAASGLCIAAHATTQQLAVAQAERDQWLTKFNASEQFQNGPTKRAEKAEAEAAALAARVQALAQQWQEDAKHQRTNDPIRRTDVKGSFASDWVANLTDVHAAELVAALAAAASAPQRIMPA